MKIVFTGGGTGGHIYPLVAVAREMRRLYSQDMPNGGIELYYVGQIDELSLILLKQEDFAIKKIISGKIRRYFDLRNFIDIFKIPLGVLQSFFLMAFLNPDVVFTKGGSGSFSVTYAAKFLRIPVLLHESDIVPGLSNQKTSAWAKKIFISFPKTEFFNPEKTTLTGNPVRKEVLNGDKQEAAKIFNLTFSKPVFLVIGGSQGAEAINDFVLNILNRLLEKYEVIHVAGRQNFDEVLKESLAIIDKGLEKYYHPIGFLEEEKLKHAYAAADIVVSRAGSSAIFEMAALGKPGILVPLPSAAGNHQSKNAYAYAEAGACLVLEQDNLTPNMFMENADRLAQDTEKLRQMKDSALAFSKPLAASTVAREILEFLTL